MLLAQAAGLCALFFDPHRYVNLAQEITRGRDQGCLVERGDTRGTAAAVDVVIQDRQVMIRREECLVLIQRGAAEHFGLFVFVECEIVLDSPIMIVLSIDIKPDRQLWVRRPGRANPGWRP